MKCAYHPERDAIGSCLSCQRGLCSECAVDMDRGLACKGRCEPEVRRLLDLRDFSFSQPHYFAERVRAGRIGRAVGIGWGLVAGSILFGIGVYYGAVPLMVVGGLAALVALVSLGFRGRQVRTDQFRLCPACGYNITGNTTGKCPECGRFV